MEEQTIRVDRALNLPTERPPYTYHKTRLVLDEMASGEVLRVRVPSPAGANNIRRSVEADGHEILDVSHQGEHEWFVTIRRK